MLAFLQGDPHAKVIAKSDIADDDPIPMTQFFRKWHEMPTWERIALQACEGKILDIGAGAGSHALMLQALDKEVHAMEISPGAVKVMQRRGVKHIIHADIFSYQGETFDTLLMMMNGIGLVGSLEGLDQFLEKAKNLLKPGGKIILDSSDITYLFTDAEGILHIDNRKRYYGEVSFQMIYGPIRGPRFQWLYIDASLLAEKAQAMGYEMEILTEGPHFEYVAKLRLKENK